MIKGQKKGELVLYGVLWSVLFMAPLLSMYVDYVTSTSTTTLLDKAGLFNAWRLLLMFFLTFCLHNFLIAPWLVYRNRHWTYALFAVLLYVAFGCYQCRQSPPEPRPDFLGQERGGANAPAGPMPSARPTAAPFHSEPGTVPQDRRLPGREAPSFHNRQPRPVPPRVFGGQDSVALIIMALLLGLNVGAKYYFKSLDDRKRFRALERENLNRQLEYLKYQINPHFFMNTLNNIHALVDIDPEQAKYTIEVLSKLMRYVLYEGNKPMAPLNKELAFVSHYVDLMRIRYTDKVNISLSLPDSPGDVEVPPLLFITFVENAFKHGVSYARHSFIEVKVGVTRESVCFSCRNSKKPTAEDSHRGVGLDNAQKRLQLIYGSDFDLKIENKENEYDVELRLPVKA